MKKLLFVVALIFIHNNLVGQKATKTENLILITLDGMRWQEVFGGAEARLIRNNKFVDDTTAIKKIFWTQTPGDRREKLMNELLFQLPNITGDTRLDGLTFHYAFEYLKKNKPRVLYLAFDETDHFAHEGQYDRYLASAHYIDGFIQTLWDWAQSQPEYKDKTTLMITADHGRGNNNNEEDWRHHGSKMPDADQIWIAILGPDTPALGEMKKEQQLYQNQLAKTLAAFLGFDYAGEGKKAGDAIH